MEPSRASPPASPGAAPSTRATRPAASDHPARPERDTPVARDPDATRNRILLAAVAEFARHGPGGARVDRIAAVAGANKRMIYYYFGSKDDLFLAVLERTYASIRAAENELELLDVAPDEAVRRLVSFTWHYYLEHPEFLSLLASENMTGASHLKRSTAIRRMHSPLVATLQTVLARGAAAGLFRPGIDAIQLYISIAALGYFYLSNAHTLSAIFGRDLLSASAKARRLDHVTDLLMNALRPGGAGAPTRAVRPAGIRGPTKGRRTVSANNAPARLDRPRARPANSPKG
jgi:AcrR family transcriptional regulator